MRRLAAILGVVALALAGCAGGGGGGSGGNGGSASAGISGPVRLLALDRRALSPAAPPGIRLIAQRPAAAPALEESVDGATFVPLSPSPAPTEVGPSAVAWDLPLPQARRFYRVASGSNIVDVDPSLPTFAPPAPPLATPGPGASAVARAAVLSIPAALSGWTTLFAVADAEGTIVFLAETAGASVDVARPRGATVFVALPAGGLRGGAVYLATAVAVSPGGFGVLAAPRIDFETAP